MNAKSVLHNKWNDNNSLLHVIDEWVDEDDDDKTLEEDHDVDMNQDNNSAMWWKLPAVDLWPAVAQPKSTAAPFMMMNLKFSDEK